MFRHESDPAVLHDSQPPGPGRTTEHKWPTTRADDRQSRAGRMNHAATAAGNGKPVQEIQIARPCLISEFIATNFDQHVREPSRQFAGFIVSSDDFTDAQP